ncbi:MAG: hypothetical protein IT531_00630 [Burkholderiales bacterium]|nr:hypothetical protein [Burkholderiales bacterium]
MLASVEAAYVAGIVDGEGTITLSRLHRNEQRRIVVCVSNERAPDSAGYMPAD